MGKASISGNTIDKVNEVKQKLERAKCDVQSVGIMILVWLYNTDVVLDGNTLKWQCTDQALKMLEIKKYAGE